MKTKRPRPIPVLDSDWETPATNMSVFREVVRCDRNTEETTFQVERFVYLPEHFR